MTIRHVSYLPNTILYQADIQKTSDNGVVEISFITELPQISNDVNVVYCGEDRNLYIRKQEGSGSSGDGTWSAVA